MKNVTKTARGFTLIEILVVIGIIAILASIVIIAINPAKQFAQARNTQRTSNVETILNAVGQNIADNKGIFGGVCGNLLPASTASSSVDYAAGGVGINLACLVPTYIPTTVPSDPSVTSATSTGYFVSVDSVGRVLVCAPNGAEAAVPGSGPICLKR